MREVKTSQTKEELEKIETKNPTQAFALDYPTDEYSREFKKSHEVKSPHGFEILDFEAQKNW